MKKALLPSLALFYLVSGAGAQTIVLANDGAEKEVTCLAFDVGFLAPPPPPTQRGGTGLAVPFIVKERFLMARNLAWPLGPGKALILTSRDVYDAGCGQTVPHNAMRDGRSR